MNITASERGLHTLGQALDPGAVSDAPDHDDIWMCSNVAEYDALHPQHVVCPEDWRCG